MFLVAVVDFYRPEVFFFFFKISNVLVFWVVDDINVAHFQGPSWGGYWEEDVEARLKMRSENGRRRLQHLFSAQNSWLLWTSGKDNNDWESCENIGKAQLKLIVMKPWIVFSWKIDVHRLQLSIEKCLQIDSRDPQCQLQLLRDSHGYKSKPPVPLHTFNKRIASKNPVLYLLSFNSTEIISPKSLPAITSSLLSESGPLQGIVWVDNRKKCFIAWGIEACPESCVSITYSCLGSFVMLWLRPSKVNRTRKFLFFLGWVIYIQISNFPATVVQDVVS